MIRVRIAGQTLHTMEHRTEQQQIVTRFDIRELGARREAPSDLINGRARTERCEVRGLAAVGR